MDSAAREGRINRINFFGGEGEINARLTETLYKVASRCIVNFAPSVLINPDYEMLY